MSDVTRYPPAGDRAYGIAPNPIRVEYLVKTRADLPRLAYLVRALTPADFAGYFETERAVGADGLVLFQVMSALCHRAGDACGVENLMVLYYDDRPCFDAVLELFRREMMADVVAALDAGVRHFFANWYYNSLSTGWSPALWREVFAPELRALVARACRWRHGELLRRRQMHAAARNARGRRH